GRVPVFTFTFGIPSFEAIREGGAVVIGTATTSAEAVELERAGVDAVIAQGAEAGGHRGTFLGSGRPALIGTFALVPPAFPRAGRRSATACACPSSLRAGSWTAGAWPLRSRSARRAQHSARRSSRRARAPRRTRTSALCSKPTGRTPR